MLEKLTPEQEALFPVIRNKWINLALDGKTELKHSKELRDGINWLYTKAKLKNKNPLIIITPSPYYAQLTANFLKNISPEFLPTLLKSLKQKPKKLGANVWANVWDNVGDNVSANVCANVIDNVMANVWANVWDNVSANVIDNVGVNVSANVIDNVRDNVWANVRNNVSANVIDNVWDNVRDNVGVNVGDNVWDNVRDNVGVNVKLEYFQVYDCLDWSSGWLSFYDYFVTIGVLKDKDFEQYRDLMSLGIWSAILFENIAILSMTPSQVLRNQSGRLHSLSGVPVKFRDGLESVMDKKLLMINGVRFDEPTWTKLIQRKLSVKEILEFSNIEQRYVALEYYGFENILDELDAKLIDESPRGNRLYQIEFKTNNQTIKTKFLRYSCPSTDRNYGSFVKPEIEKADQAMAWKHNMSEDEYEVLKVEA